MSNFTSGKLAITIAQLETDASLTAIAQEMANHPPAHAGLISGWGSIHDNDDNLGAFAPAPTPGVLTVEPPVGAYRERLFARMYFWVQDSNARRFAGANANPKQISRLRACDFMLTRISPSSILVAISSRNAADLEHTFKPLLEAIAMAVDPRARLLLDTSPLALGSDDVFMWLLNRYDTDRQLTPNLELANVREITSQDPLSRGANLSHGVDLSRRELLALITNHAIRFGPAKLVTFEAASSSLIDMELHLDGGFAIQTGESHYRQKVMGRAVIGPQALNDLVFVVIPALRHAYEFDRSWHNGGRQAFVTKCLSSLQRTPSRVQSLSSPCPHCGVAA